jgi:phage gpG-like protein
MAGRTDVQVRVRDLGQIIPPQVREAILRHAATHAIGIILKRTAAGIDAEGRPFKAYAKGYAKLRAASGRRSSPVDLTLGGDMLASMTVLDVSAERALIGFQGSSTAYQFQRMRTKRGTKTSRWVERSIAGGMTRRRKLTHTLARKGQRPPVANAVKAAAHNKGNAFLPRRHFFALSDAERREVLAEAARTLRIRR